MLRFIDSFDHYAAPDFLKKWTSLINSGISIGPGRNGNGLYFGQGLLPSAISKTIDFQVSWYVGFAFNMPAALNLPFNAIYQLWSNDMLLGGVSFNNDSTLNLFLGNKNVKLISKPIIQSSTWYYFEIHITANGASGSIDMQINGAPVGTGSGPIATWDSSRALGAGGNRHVFSGSGMSNGSIIDDLYILDNQTGLNSYLGDVKISCIFPRQNVTTDFSTNPAHTDQKDYLNVRESPPDYDASTVYANTVGKTETFFFDQVPSFQGTIPGVQLNIMAKKDDEGYRAFQPLMGSIPTTSKTIYVNDSYVNYTFQDDSGWTPASVNGSAFGCKIIL